MKEYPDYLNWKIFNSKFSLVLFVVLIVFSLGYLYSVFSDRQLENERIQKIDATKTFYCKELGFENRKSCIAFLERNDELFLVILSVQATLNRLKVKFDSYYGLDLGIVPKGSYEDLRKMNFYTNYMTENDNQLVKLSKIREQPLNAKIKINAYISSHSGLLEGDENVYISFTENGVNHFLNDNKLSHKYLTFDQTEQITKICGWPLGSMCPANIYIQIQKCKIIPHINRCLIEKPILVIIGIKFLKKNFAEFVSRDRACFISNIKKYKDIELIFRENLINKLSAKESCEGNDYYEFTKDIQILNRIRIKYPFILKKYNNLIGKLEILLDPDNGAMKLSSKGKELVAREINYQYSDKNTKVETSKIKMIDEVKELF